MYQTDDLAVYPFFRPILRDTPIAAVLDSLTGVVSRPYILQFIRHLIDARVPFTLGIIDMDNFKSVNDNYGHGTGDAVLTQVSDALRAFMGGDGLVGRFGGDEFLAVCFRDVHYDGAYDFYRRMFGGAVFRRKLSVNGNSLYVTATVGCAAFPQDAEDYDDLFSRVDKALYRGKSKGRNCYIIYVKEKHQHLEIGKLAMGSLCDTLRFMARGFDTGGDLMDRLRRAFEPMEQNLHIHGLLYADADEHLIQVSTGADVGQMPGLLALVSGSLLALNNFDSLVDGHPVLFHALTSLELGSALLAAVGDPAQGCLIFCPESHTMHIWQDEERAAAFFLSRLVEHHLASALQHPN